MPPPKLVAPDHLTGIAAARWHKNHVSLSGGAVTNVACTGIRMKQRKRLQRIRGNNAVEEQRDRAALAVLERSTGTLIKAEAGWRAPINVPAVCMIDDLNLKKTSSPTDIQKALVWLEKYNGLVYVLLLFTLDNFTPACLPPLLRVLQAKNIFSLNLGEAGKRLQQVDYKQLLTHLKSPAGAAFAAPCRAPRRAPRRAPHHQPDLACPVNRCEARDNLPLRRFVPTAGTKGG